MKIIRVHPYGTGGVKCTVCGATLESATDPEGELWTEAATIKEFIQKMKKEHYMQHFLGCEEYIVMSVQTT